MSILGGGGCFGRILTFICLIGIAIVAFTFLGAPIRQLVTKRVNQALSDVLPGNHSAPGTNKRPADGPAFQGCPVEGRGGDPELNRLKNRTAGAASYQPATIESLLMLEGPKPTGRSWRNNWSTKDLDMVAPREASSVSLEGYLVKIREEGAEGSNCRDAKQRDYHLWLASSPGGDRGKSIVVEVTPRVKALHSSWTIDSLQKLISQQSRVRISGWLLFDHEHPEQVHRTRGTLWEIHPITAIEYQSGARWEALQ